MVKRWYNTPAFKFRKFCDYLSPIFVKELRQGLRANHFVWPFIVVQLAAITCLGMEFIGQEVANVDNAFTRYLFPFMLLLVFGAVLPLTCFNSLHSEVAIGKNIELLLMSNLTRWQIVLGKWTVANVLGLLLLSSLLPYWLARYICGNFISLTIDLATVSGLIGLNWVMNAIVIGASSLKTPVAKIFMIAFSAVFGLLTIQALMIPFLFGFTEIGGFPIFLALGLLATTLVSGLNLQFGRSKLRLFTLNPEASTASSIGVLIFLTPFLIGVCLGPLMGIILVIVILRTDPELDTRFQNRFAP